MNEFYRYILRHIAKKLVVQSNQHKFNITEYYVVMAEAAQEEFREDTIPGLDNYLKECHARSLWR